MYSEHGKAGKWIVNMEKISLMRDRIEKYRGRQYGINISENSDWDPGEPQGNAPGVRVSDSTNGKL